MGAAPREPVAPEDEAAARRRRAVSVGGLARAAFNLVLLVTFVGVSAFYFATRTHTGQVWVVDKLLDQLTGDLNGTVTVADVSSPNLLDGVILHGVSITDPEGRPFVEVDSVRARYSVAQLLAGSLTFSDIVAHRPRVRIATLEEDARSNAEVIFGGPSPSSGVGVGEATADSAAADSVEGGRGLRVVLRRARVFDGEVELLQPAGEDAGGLGRMVEAPGGGRLRSFKVAGLGADLPRASLASAEDGGVEVTVASLSFEAGLFQEPLHLEELQGMVRFQEGRLEVDADVLRLPESELEGTARADLGAEEGPSFELALDAASLELADVSAADPRIPEGTFRGGLSLVMDGHAMDLGLEDATVDLGGERVGAEGGIGFADSAVRFDGLNLDLAAVDLRRLDPWIGEPLPLDGRVTGDLALNGPLEGVRTSGRLTLVPPAGEDASTTAVLDGVLRLGDDPGASDLVATLDPLDYRTLARLAGDAEGLGALGGRGRATVELTGRLSDGISFTGDLVHAEPDLPPSRVAALGSVRRAGGDLVLDVLADVAPLSLTTLARYREDLPLSGEVSGSIGARGPLSDLTVTTALETEAGYLDLVSRLNVRRPAAGYTVEGTVEDVPLSRLVPGLPEPSRVSGDLALEGRGLTPDSVEASGRLIVRPSVLGGIPVDTLRADFDLADGQVAVDSLEAVAVGIGIRGGGRMPWEPGGGEGTMRIEFVGESLEGFRTLIRGEEVIARDTLQGLELDVVEARGVDLDTLPLLEEVAVGGRVEGELTAQGSIRDFGVSGEARFQELVWGTSFVRDLRVEVEGEGLPERDGRILATLDADSIDVMDRSFDRGRFTVDYTGSAGRVEGLLARGDDEDYQARGVVQLDSVGGQVDLEALELRLDSLTWALQDRASIEWDADAVRADELVVAPSNGDPMRLRLGGRIARRGEVDFTVDVDALRLPRLARFAQREDLDLQGTADLTLRVTGTASDPVIHGDVTARGLAYRTWDLGLLLGSFDYRGLQSAVDLRAWREDRQVLVATGSVPADLRLAKVEDRVPDGRSMDVRVVADSLPAAFATTFIRALEDVEGTIAGDFRLGGTVEAPSPTGTLRIQDAAWTMPALGVRHEGVEGTLSLDPGGTVTVAARAQAGGTARVTGAIQLEPLTDPGFDLVLAFNDFTAVDRRDMAGRVGGEVSLTGTFRQPLVQGREAQGRGLSARGDLFVEEFQRASTVIDLSDPRFGRLVDADFFERAQSIFAESRNPFLDNLRVDVDVVVQPDTWLRSSDMNVEIAGNLAMTYHRQERDMALQGTLQAVRGSYTSMGKRFEVAEGTVDFVGTPGVDPNLSIVATTTVRRPGNDPLDITATVTGTLSNPRLQLGSDEQAVAQEDLVSYLLFGRPSYELTSGQAQGVQETSALLGSTAWSAGFGTLTSQIGSLLGQRFGLDYFAISSGNVGRGEAAAGALAQTTIEFGDYLGDDLFWVLTVRPAGTEGRGTLGTLPGVRLEWQATDAYKVEAFVDDRFLRSGAISFRELAFTQNRVFGLNIFREWTY